MAAFSEFKFIFLHTLRDTGNCHICYNLIKSEKKLEIPLKIFSQDIKVVQISLTLSH